MLKEKVKDTLKLLNFYRVLLKAGTFHSQLRYSLVPRKREMSLLCNGPSLKPVLENIDKLQGQDLVVVNYLGNTELFKKIRPRIYCLCDGMFFTDVPNNSRRDEILRLYKNLQESVGWEMELIVPYCYKEKFLKFSKLTNPHIHVLYANTLDADLVDEKWRTKLYLKNYACPTPQTVAILAIYAGINLGYKIINLYGVDHTYTQSYCVNDDNQVCMKYEHFYEKEVEMKPIVDALGGVPTFASELQTIVNMFRSHEKLEAYAKSVGCKIWNCTKGSFIDSYSRKSVDF